MLHLPHRLVARPLLVMAVLALLVGCTDDSGGDIISGSSDVVAGDLPTNTPIPPPPATATFTPTPELTPVVPPTGGTYEIRAFFVLDEGACGGPGEYQDTLVIDFAAGGQTSAFRRSSTGDVNTGIAFPIVLVQATAVGRTVTFRQPSTGDVNTGMVQPDGTFEVSSQKESYSGTFEFVRDETGKVVRLILRATNTFQNAQGCVAKYKVEGEVEVQGE